VDYISPFILYQVDLSFDGRRYRSIHDVIIFYIWQWKFKKIQHTISRCIPPRRIIPLRWLVVMARYILAWTLFVHVSHHLAAGTGEAHATRQGYQTDTRSSIKPLCVGREKRSAPEGGGWVRVAKWGSVRGWRRRVAPAGGRLGKAADMTEQWRPIKKTRPN
jgi:hypothetical protein